MPAGSPTPTSSVIRNSPVNARTRAEILARVFALVHISNKPNSHHPDNGVVAARENENGSRITDVDDDTPVDHSPKVTMQSIAGPSARGIVFLATQPPGDA